MNTLSSKRLFAQLSFAKGALQQNHIRLLLTINNEANVRRSTKSLVLGKTKVMGYEERKVAREKRVEKDAAQKVKGKGKRGQNRTSAVLEADAAEPSFATGVVGRSKRIFSKTLYGKKQYSQPLHGGNRDSSATGNIYAVAGRPVQQS
ncbi:hypothetical protein BU25DRAFT_495530 [Macroventuria anomochaeta]|uniref:Uncharacterized protein n=1 Tax=Macroventuria anomochaeta TaxID=301207 RepID=A0ACB6RLJ7_9PLEO|nr:uncharacterized protein BU25DRAFT_495530 [Macroventuria anomochaeta]KAF2621819.1 hypothetical protein BU25DRAFT_495530 [Macroventuria anomochaeta]